MTPPLLRATQLSPAGGAHTAREFAQPAGGINDGDIMVAFILVETSQNPITGLAQPGGWTLELDHYSGLVAGQEGHILVYTKRASGESGSYSFSWTSLLWTEGQLLVYSGCPPSGAYTDLVSAATPVNGTSINWSDTTNSNDTELAFCVRQFNGGAFTGPGTEVYDGGSLNETAAYDAAGPATAGATGTKTFTSAGSGQLQAVGIALKAAVVVATSKGLYPRALRPAIFAPGLGR